MGSLSGGLASMGAAVPYAIAAKFAHPDRPVVALVGDGAMQMNGNAELVTVLAAARDAGRAGELDQHVVHAVLVFLQVDGNFDLQAIPCQVLAVGVDDGFVRLRVGRGHGRDDGQCRSSQPGEQGAKEGHGRWVR